MKVAMVGMVEMFVTPTREMASHLVILYRTSRNIPTMPTIATHGRRLAINIIGTFHDSWTTPSCLSYIGRLIRLHFRPAHPSSSSTFTGGDGAISTSDEDRRVFIQRDPGRAPDGTTDRDGAPTETPVIAPPPAFVAPFAALIDGWIATEAPTKASLRSTLQSRYSPRPVCASRSWSYAICRARCARCLRTRKRSREQICNPLVQMERWPLHNRDWP